MRERLKRIFGTFGGFLGRVATPLAVAIVVVFVLGWGVGWPVATAYLAHDSGFHRGWTYDLVSDLKECRKERDAAAVESGKLQYQRDELLKANTEFITAIQQLQAQMANMFPLEAIQWCDASMSDKVLPEGMRDIITKTAILARGINPDVKFDAVCVSVDDILTSPLRGEMVFRVIRYYPNGDRDWLIVYWRLLPGSAEGELRTAEFYNVLTREHCWLDEATQSWLCKNPSP